MSLLLDNPTLLVAFRDGDRSALERIYRAYVDDVAALVRRGFVYDRTKVVSVGGVTDEVRHAEVVQETFARAFSVTGRTGYDGRSPFRPYLLRIAKNLMIDELCRSGRTVSFDDLKSAGDVDSIIAGNQPLMPESGAEIAHWQRQHQATSAFIARLDGELRQLYALRYDEGLPQEEVASHLGCTRRRVRTLEKQLRKQLYDALVAAGLWP